MSSNFDIKVSQINEKLNAVNGSTTLDQLAEIKKNILEIPFWDRTHGMHKSMISDYTEYEKECLEVSKIPYYGRSDKEHCMLQSSGFYTD